MGGNVPTGNSPVKSLSRSKSSSLLNRAAPKAKDMMVVRQIVVYMVFIVQMA